MPNYKRLTPFKRCVLQNFPFIEADFDALTNYGLLCKIVEYLNNVISSQNEVQENVEALNNAFIELKNYVDNFFDNLDVQEEINNKLDEMAEDGTLEDIIRKIVNEDDQANFHTYFATKYYRNSDSLAGMQGGCILPDGTIFQSTGRGKLLHYSSDGTLLNSTDAVYGHGNACCYNAKEGKIILTSTQDNTIGKYKLFKIDPETLTISETIDLEEKLPFEPYGVAYIEETEEYVFIDYWSAGHTTQQMCKTDSEFNVIESKSFNISIRAASCLGIYRDYLGVQDLTSNKILLFSKNMEFYKQIEVNPLVEDTWFITEVEWFGTLNDKVYMGFVAHGATHPSWGGGTKIYAKFDPSLNYTDTSQGTTTILMPCDETYYVDQTNENPLRNGSNANPFTNIQEALNSALRTKNVTGNVEIRLKTNTEEDIVPLFQMNKNYRISASYSGTAEIKHFGGLLIKQCASVEIRRGVKLTGESQYDQLSTEAAQVQCMGKLYVNGRISNSANSQVTFTGTEQSYIKAGIGAYGAIFTTYTGVFDNIQTGRFASALISTPAYNADTYIVNRSINGVKLNLTADDSGNFTLPFLARKMLLTIRANYEYSSGVTVDQEFTIPFSFGEYQRLVFPKNDGTVVKITIEANGVVKIPATSFTSIRCKAES